MKITLDQARLATNGINMVIYQELPAKTSYWVNKLSKILNKIGESVEDVVGKYRYNPEGISAEEAQEKEAKFQEAWNAIKDNEEEIQEIKFSPEDFGDIKINPIFWELIEPFVKCD
jgi:hypothetical protein